MHNFWLSLILYTVFSFPGSLSAQDSETGSTLKGKTVGIWFSLKEYSFSEDHNILLSQFIKTDQGKDVMVEDIKRQSLVSIGTLFAEQLKEAAGADSVIFLNGEQELGRAFRKVYQADKHYLPRQAGTFSSMDYILVVNPLVLGAYYTTSVYPRSNKIVTERVVVQTGRVRIDLYDPDSGLLRHIHEACADERETEFPKPPLFDFSNRKSRSGAFLANLLSLAMTHLNQGEKGNCEQEK